MNKQSFKLVPKYQQVNVSSAFAKKAMIVGSVEHVFVQDFKASHQGWTFHHRNGEQIFL